MVDADPGTLVATSPPDGRTTSAGTGPSGERRRPVKIYFFLEDDTFQIRECRHREGDIPQSTCEISISNDMSECPMSVISVIQVQGAVSRLVNDNYTYKNINFNN